MFKLDRTDTPAGGEHATVYLVFELSKKTWQLGVLRPGSDKMSRYSIAGGDLAALTSRLARCRAEAAQGGQPVRILSCYGFRRHLFSSDAEPEGVRGRGCGRCPRGSGIRIGFRGLLAQEHQLLDR